MSISLEEIDDILRGASSGSNADPATPQLPQNKISLDQIDNVIKISENSEEIEKVKDNMVLRGFGGRFGQDAERKAEILELARNSGANPYYVQENFEKVRDTWFSSQLDPKKWRQENPALFKEMFERPDLGEVIGKDQKLSFYSQAMAALSEAAALASYINPQLALTSAQLSEMKTKALPGYFRKDGIASTAKPTEIPFYRYQETAEQMKLSGDNFELMIRQLLGMDTYDLEMSIIDRQQRLIPRDFGEDNFQQIFSDAAEGMASTVDVMKAGGAAAVTTGVAAGVAKAGLKAIPHPLAKSTAEAIKPMKAAAFFGKAGMFVRALHLEGGDTFSASAEWETDDGQKLTLEERAGVALVAGFLKAGMEFASVNMIIKATGPLGKSLLAGQQRKAYAQLMKDAKFRDIVANVGRDVKKAVGVELTTEMLQTVTDQLADYFSRSWKDGKLQEGPIFEGEEIALSGQKGAAGGAAMASFAGTISLASEAILIDRARLAGLQMAEINNLSKAQAPSIRAAPESVVNITREVTAKTGKPVDTVYVDAEAFGEVFRGNQQELDSAAIEFLGEGGDKKVREAIATGGRIEVPLEDYLTKWGPKPISEVLEEHTTVDATLPTPFQVKQLDKANKALQEKFEKLAKKYERQDAKAESEAEARLVNAIERKMIASGVHKPTEIRKMTAMWRAFIRTISEKAKKDPDELFNSYALSFELGDGGTIPEGALLQAKAQKEWHSSLVKAVEGQKQEKNTALAWKAILEKAPGVKKEEIQFTKLFEFLAKERRSLTKAEVIEHINNHLPQIEVLTIPDHYNKKTYFEGYTLRTHEPGSYRELLFYAPNTPSEDFLGPEGHWGRVTREVVVSGVSVPEGWVPANQDLLTFRLGNIGNLAHARITTQILSSGEKILFIEEIQSDLHAFGQKFGTFKQGEPNTKLDFHVEGELDTGSEREAKIKSFLHEFTSLFSLDLPNHTYNLLVQRMESILRSLKRDNLTIDEYLDNLEKTGRLIDFLEGFGVVDLDQELLFVSRMAPVDRENAIGKVKLAVALAEKKGLTYADFVGLVVTPYKAPLAPEGAPFRDSYEEFIAKHLLWLAAKEGFRKIGWTTGKTQSERYDGTAEEGMAVHYDVKLPSIMKKLLKKDGVVVEKAELASGSTHLSSEITLKPAPEGTKAHEVLLKISELLVAPEDPAAAPNEKQKDLWNRIHELVNIEGESSTKAILRAHAEAVLGDSTRLSPLGGIATRVWDVLEGPDESGIIILEDSSLVFDFDESVEDGTSIRTLAHLDEHKGVSIDNVPTGWEVYAKGRDRATEGGEIVWTASLSNSFRARALSEGMPLFQDSRGYTLREKNLFKIVLNPEADLSTFLHESAHVWLYMLGDLASRDDVAQELKDDYAKILKFLGAKDSKSITEDMHEKFADAFERYLLEGKSPSIALERHFKSFKRWLKKVYKTVTGGVPEDAINPEIKDIFDRLFATDAEMELYQFRRNDYKSAEEAGMSPEQWQAYLKLRAEMVSRSARAAELRALRASLKQLKKAHSKEKKRIEDQLNKEYEEIPAVKALNFLRGKTPAGVIALDREIVERVLGKDLAKVIPFTSETGTNPDDVANLHGFATGEEMLRAIAEIPKKKDWIARETAKRLHEKYPDALRQRELLKEEIDKGHHNDYGLKKLAAEWRAIRRKENPKAFDNYSDEMLDSPLKGSERTAKKIVWGKRVTDLSVARTSNAERSASDKALQAMAKKDFKQALYYKLQEVLNFFIWREMMKARKSVEKFIDLAASIKKSAFRQKIASAAPEYLDGLDAILEHLQLKKPRENRRRALATFEDIVSQLEADGVTPFDPDELKKILGPKSKSWKRLTVRELGIIKNVLSSLKTAALNRQKALVEGKREEQDTVAEQMKAEIRTSLKPEDPLVVEEALTKLEQGGVFLGSLLASLRKPIEVILRAGGGTIESTWYKAIALPLIKATHMKTDLRARALRPIMQAFDNIPEGVRKRFTEAVDGHRLFKTHVRDLVPRTRFELLMLVANWGNEGNQLRVMEGRKIQPDEVMHVINEVLTKEEMQWIQSLWDASEQKFDWEGRKVSLWDLASELEERDSGIVPDKVEAKELVTKHGTFRGGYWPAVYDLRVEQAELKGQSSFGNYAEFLDPFYVRPNTPHGYMKRRVKHFSGAITFSPSVIQYHLEQVIHDISHREAVKSVAGLLMRDDIRDVLHERLGPEYRQQLMQWVRDIGRAPSSEAMVHTRRLSKWVQTRKRMMSQSLLGLRVALAATEAPKVALGLRYVKKEFWIDGLLQFAANPAAAFRFAAENSGEIRTRTDDIKQKFDIQMRQLTDTGILSKGPLAWYRDHAFTFMDWAFKSFSTPVWLGAYKQSMAAHGDKQRAIDFANSVIEKIFVSYNPVSQAPIFRDKGFVGTSVMFYGELNVGLNMMVESVIPFLDKKDLQSFGKMSGSLLALFTMYNLLPNLILGRGPPPGGDDPLKWAKWAALQLATAPFQMLPEIGNIAEDVAMHAVFKTGRNPNIRTGPAHTLGDAVLKVIRGLSKVATGEAEYKDYWAVLKAFGLYHGVPTHPIDSAGMMNLKLARDETQARNALDYASGVVYGPDRRQLNPISGLDEALHGPKPKQKVKKKGPKKGQKKGENK
jgi:hypothetical protein